MTLENFGKNPLHDKWAELSKVFSVFFLNTQLIFVISSFTNLGKVVLGIGSLKSFV